MTARPTGGTARRLCSAICWLLLAIAVTWPLARHLGTRLPIGTEPGSTVPRFNLWTLRWNADRINHGWSGYWDAPSFWPSTSTFALSEPQPLTGVWFWLLRMVRLGPVSAYGVIVLVTLAANGALGSRLARRLGMGSFAAVAVGVGCLTLQFTVNERGVLQLLALWPMLWVWERVLSYGESPSLTGALTAGLAVAAVFATCGYSGVFLVLTGVPLLALVLTPAWRSLDWPVSLAQAASGAAVAALGLTSTWLQVSLTPEVSWSRATILANSADWAAFTRLVPGPDGQGLSPGWLVMALAVAGLVVGLSHRAHRRATVAFAVVGVLAMFLAMGLRLSAAGFVPYRFLVEHFGLDRLRSPFRAAVIAQLVLVLLAGFALDSLARFRAKATVVRPAPRSGLVAALAAILVLAVVVTGRSAGWGSAPLSSPEPIRSSRAWVRWLTEHPGGAVAHVPTVVTGGQEKFVETTGQMLASLDHGHPILGGYTGFFPDEFAARARLVDQIGSVEARAALRDLGIRYLVVDLDSPDAPAARSTGVVVEQDGDVLIVDLGT